MIPREPAERVPVGLCEVGAAPVAIAPRVGHTRNASASVTLQRTIDHARYGRALALRVCLGCEHFAEEGTKVDQVRGEAQVLPGDLEFHHERRLRHAAEPRMEWLARLKVEGPVLYLHEHVVAELPIERLELVVRLANAVHGLLVAVHEGSPDHHTAVRC